MTENNSDLVADAVAGVDYLRVAGSVKLGDREGNILLITREKVYGFRVQRKAKPAKSALGRKLQEIVHDLFGYGFNQRKEGEQLIANPMNVPEFRSLGPTLAQSIEGAMLIGEFALDRSLQIEATRLGFEFSKECGKPMVFRGTSQKKPIADFLATVGFEI